MHITMHENRHMLPIAFIVMTIFFTISRNMMSFHFELHAHVTYKYCTTHILYLCVVDSLGIVILHFFVNLSQVNEYRYLSKHLFFL